MSSLLSSRMGEVEMDEVILKESPDFLESAVKRFRRHRIRPQPLSELNDLRIQQGLIIKDLLFALRGYEGFYIRYSEKFDVGSADMRIRGPDFKIAKHLDISLKTITKRLVKYGKFYFGVKSFAETYNKNDSGKVNQRLSYCIREFLHQYTRVVSDIENDFKHNNNYNLNILDNNLNQNVQRELEHLYEIVNIIHSETEERQRYIYKTKNAQFEDFITKVRTSLKQSGDIDTSVDSDSFPSCKGGLVLRIVQNRLNAYKGDSRSYKFLSSMFASLSQDYTFMLNNWLINGEIDDPFKEFFIREKPVPRKLLAVFDSKNEHYWNELFVIRADGLVDQFQDRSVQTKILQTGKLLNIFKMCTNLENFDTFNEGILPIDNLYSPDLELKIDQFCTRANKLFMGLMIDGFNFLSTFDDLQRIFLLDSSFHVDKFIDKCFQDLKKSRYSISVTKLQNSFNEIFKNTQDFEYVNRTNLPIREVLFKGQRFSVTSSNFYEVAREIMNVSSFDADRLLQEESNIETFINKAFERKQVNSADSNKSVYDPDHTDDYAIASIDLTVDLPFPLNLVINRESLYHYELMFKLQMIIRFVDKFNDITWREINYSYVWNYKRFTPKMKKWILRCRALHNRMRQFMKEFESYLSFDVIEKNYLHFKSFNSTIAESLKEATSMNNANANTNDNIFDSNVTNANTNKFTSYNNYNGLFDEKLSTQHSTKKNNGHPWDVSNFVFKLNEYLNTIVNDSLITRMPLLSVTKNMLDTIVSFNHYLARVKKGLILCDADLCSSFAQEYPDRFMNKDMSQAQIDRRFARFDENLKDYYNVFSDSLTDFIVSLKSYGEAENKQILLLSERLENSFPEN